MSLSLRLSEVKNTVRPCSVVCDIGCDHGFVSIELMRTKTADRVIACDINKGPLEAAKANIEAAGYGGAIETRLSDGLHNITLDDKADAIVIAGMGGALMTKILTEGITVVKNAKQLVLQPQSEVFLVRKWLRDNGYNIICEKMLIDAGKYYVIIDAVNEPSKPVEDEYIEVYDNYSEYLISHKDPVLKEYLERGILVNEGYLSGMSEDKQDAVLKKIKLMKQALSLMA